MQKPLEARESGAEAREGGGVGPALPSGDRQGAEGDGEVGAWLPAQHCSPRASPRGPHLSAMALGRTVGS